MATTYTTRDGDVLDAICWRYYGDTELVVTVLESNPGLCEQGQTYPAGIVIILPDRPAPAVQQSVSLWD